MKARRRDIGPRMLAAYVEGEVTRSEGAAVEANLAESLLARQKVASLRQIGECLSAPISEIERIDLVVPWRRAPRVSSAAWHRLVRGASYALAVAAVAVVAIALRKPAAAEFRAKSAASGEHRERWAGIRVYRVDASGEATRLVDRVHAADGLLFSYSNLGPRPLGHLIVFGVDARHVVRWFYPAFDEEGTDPASIEIKKGDADVALPDIIHHDLPSGPLAIHAVFTNRPLHVLEVEALVRERSDPSAELSLPGAVEQVVTTRVEP
jgi:hypothetical protein